MEPLVGLHVNAQRSNLKPLLGATLETVFFVEGEGQFQPIGLERTSGACLFCALAASVLFSLAFRGLPSLHLSGHVLHGEFPFWIVYM